MKAQHLVGEEVLQITGLSDLGKEAPKELWMVGEDRRVLQQPQAAVIGSRRMTNYGARVVESLVYWLVHEGMGIVSGLMYGVDETAHKVCVECGGRAIAVLGWGIEERLENSDQRLVKKIIETGGLIISEWKKQQGALWTFPRRNRIVAAMCQRIYVVEAGIKSGSLITVEWGERLKREIWAVPGPITSKVSEGTNMLIASGRAKMWTPDLGIRQQAIGTSKNAEIYSLLQNEALSIDELALATGRPVAEIGVELTMAQLRGEVEERGGKYYIGDGKI